MNIHVVGVGEWMKNLMCRMETAVDGDFFVLPSQMHLHAYSLVKETHFPGRDFKVSIASQEVAA